MPMLAILTTMTCKLCAEQQHALKENERSVIILSNPHKVPGHMLVMPKRHIEMPWELTPEELQDIFGLIFFAEQRLLGKLGEGVDIRQSYWPFKGEDKLKARHLVFHIIPRSPGDYLFQVSDQYKDDLYVDLDSMEYQAVAKILQD